MLKRLTALALLLALLIGLLPAVALPEVEAAETSTRATTAGSISASTSTITSLFNARSKGVHPRIFANDADFARLRKLVQTDPYSKMIYARIYNFCLTLFNEPLLKYEKSDGKLLNVCKQATKRIGWLAMTYQISGERRFAERAVEEMINVCSFTDWNPTHYLDTAEMGLAVGIGYDWLYHYMTDAQRKTVLNGLYKKGITTQDPPPVCMTKVNNWNPWCNGGISVAAAAAFESYPSECATILSNAVKNVQISMTYQPSGAYPEGPGYAAVGLALTAYLIETLSTVLGTDFGLSEVEGMKESGRYFVATNGYLYNFNFGDGGTTFRNNAVMHWYANRYNMPELSVYQREHQSTTDRGDEYLSLLWYNPELVEGVSNDDRQLDYFLKSDEYESVASFRSFPGDEAQVYAAIKSGYNQTGHTDLDIGTFVMEALGEYWFVELGSDSYSLSGYMDRTENGGRWKYYRNRAEGQNTIVINPDATGGQVFDAACQITDYQSTYDGGYAIVNMKDAYDGYGATSARRSLALFDNRTRVRLRDEINCSSASTIYWFAHTQANISISSDGKTATLTQNGKTLIAQIASPDGAKFTQMNAKPLSTSPNPSGQNANEGYRKLVIKLTKTTSASITVFFTPVLSTGNTDQSLPCWGITNTGKLLNQYDPSTTLTANAEGVYEIYTTDQLCLLSQMVADGETFSGKTVKLMQDIDMKGRTFQPIGSSADSTAFKGIFDGCGHVVRNLLINKADVDGVAFFGRASGATIRNFGIEGGTVFGAKASAGLVGYGISVTIENCFNRANVIGAGSHCGGLGGQISGTSAIRNCYNNAYVKTSGNVAGGIIGYISSSSTVTVENCYHVGNLTDGTGRLGMIGYYNSGTSSPVNKVTVKNCRATTAIKSADVADNSSLESYSGNSKITKAQMVSAAVALGSSFIYDCEWENDGYPVLSWQCDTVLPEDLILSTSAQLRLFAYHVNSGKDYFAGKTVRLAKDIDLDSREWTPIGGNNTTDTGGKAFQGTFDGQGYSISNLRVSSNYYYVGFFGNSKGTIRNLGIRSGSVKGANKAAGLAGLATGTISSCYSRATVSSAGYAGGLVGMGSKTVIENSYAQASVTSSGSAGGLIAYFASSTTEARITNCYAACTVSGKYAGSLVCNVNAAVTDLIITNSYALNSQSLVYSTTGYTLKNSSVQSAANLKAKTATLGAAYEADDYIAKNSGYPVLSVFAYKSENMYSLQPNSAGVYEIHNAQELRAIAYMVNKLGNSFSGKTVQLCADIDLENEEWTPIGGNAAENGSSTHVFSGIFDGKGHKIHNLNVSRGNYYVGFFGDLSGATIRNFGIESGRITGISKVGGITGTTRSNVKISDCYNKAAVCGESSVGGIVGMVGGANCVMDNCYNTASADGGSSAAGIVGYLSSTTSNVLIRSCYNSGISRYGIVETINETATGTISNCYTVDTLNPVGTANAVTVSNTSKLTAAELRNAAKKLSASFAEDYFTQNSMYPVLTWENGTRSTTLPLVNGVYEVGTADQLRLVSYMVRKGTDFSGKTIALTADIDLENKLWLPIGGTDGTSTYHFKGTFEGNGHLIHNLNVWEKGLNYMGLFGYATGATIRNLGIESGVVIGNTRAAALVARAQTGTVISGCYNKALVYADSYTGAFAAIISGANCVIENCYNMGEIFARAKTSSTGGLVGYLNNDAQNPKLLNCYNVGNYYGIIGSVHASATGAVMENCYSVATVRMVRVSQALSYGKSAQIGSDTLKGYASTLGAAYTTDTQSINKGYPILFWQSEGHCFHKYNLVSDGAATHSKVCSLCGDRITENHTWDAGVVTKAATCTTPGVKTYTCTVCKTEKPEAIAASGHKSVADAAVAPTCTTAGKTAGAHCSICKAVLTAQTTVPATGHSYSYTNLGNGNHTATCKTCRKTVTEAHSYTKGFCVCGDAEIKEPQLDQTLKINHTLNLASDISVNFAVAKSLLTDFDLSTVYLECAMDTYEGNTKTGSTTVKLLPVEQGAYYYFTLTGLTAIQMNDRLSSVLYGSKNGQPYYSPTDSYSIADYAYSQLNKEGSTASLKTLCADLLRYGSYAQSFKGYRTNALVDASMTAAQKACLSNMSAVTFGNNNATLSDLSNPSITWAGKALDLESKVALKFVFNPANYQGDPSTLTLKVSYTDINGTPKSLSIKDPELYNPDMGLYVFTLDALLAAELRSVVSVQIFARDIPVSCTLQYSADTYGNNKTGNLLELCKALFAYSDSAKAYFQ